MDKIVIIILLIMIFLFASLFTYLIIRGGSKNKTFEEKKLEDKEQLEYLRNYKSKGGKNNGRNNK